MVQKWKMLLVPGNQPSVLLLHGAVHDYYTFFSENVQNELNMSLVEMLAYTHNNAHLWFVLLYHNKATLSFLSCIVLLHELKQVFLEP